MTPYAVLILIILSLTLLCLQHLLLIPFHLLLWKLSLVFGSLLSLTNCTEHMKPWSILSPCVTIKYNFCFIFLFVCFYNYNRTNLHLKSKTSICSFWGRIGDRPQVTWLLGVTTGWDVEARAPDEWLKQKYPPD